MFRLKNHYFSQRLGTEIKEVYWHTLLSVFALGLVMIFEPIYLYKLGYSLTQILWFYIIVYVGYILFIGFGAKFAGWAGYKHSILISKFFYILYWLALFQIKNIPGLFLVAPLLFALEKSFFWPAYDAAIAVNEGKKQRGKEVGVLFSIHEIAFAAAPFAGGLLAEEFGFGVLFAAAAALKMISVYPLFRSPEIRSEHSFKFKILWSIAKRYTRNIFGYWGYAEDLMIMSLWPVYIFIILPDVLEVGAVSTIAGLIGVVLMLYIGKISDYSYAQNRILIKFSSLVYGVTWIFRFLAAELYTILTFDSLTKASKDAVNVPMMALTFRNAGEKDHDQAIAYSVFYEASLSVGKIITAFAGILILSFTGNIFLVFALVGLMTMLYGMLK